MVTVLSYQYFENHEGQREELYLLLLLATLGCAVLVTSSHFASFILGLEVLSVSLYGMVAYLTDRKRALEAGIKYLILASASAAFLLFGMALIYAAAGTMEFSQLREVSPGGSRLHSPVRDRAHRYRHRIQAGSCAVPSVDAGCIPGCFAARDGIRRHHLQECHGGAVAALFLPVGRTCVTRLCSWSVATIAVLSMCAGNLLALRQTNVKRILAYSSIAHFGYILVAFLAGSTMAIEAVAFYLVAYTVTILAAFGVVIVPLQRRAAMPRIWKIIAASSGAGRQSQAYLPRRCCRWPAFPPLWAFWASFISLPREPTPRPGR